MLFDNHGRKIDYLRLAVTDRCNLRCFYCMPENGIKYLKRKDLLTYEEMHRIVRVLSELGVSKIRITGGEPFVRKGIDEFLKSISEIDGIQQLNLTTNGTFTKEKISFLEEIGIQSVNLSLDSLDKERFKAITRQDLFEEVYQTFEALVGTSLKIKINMVVMQGKNIEDIYPMLELTRDRNVSVRFIEEMPFNGTDGQGNPTFWPQRKILEHIQQQYAVEKLIDPPSSTSYNYQIQGYAGTFGLIAAYTRTFCGSCNRIRLTPQGTLRTCLYGEGVFNFRDFIREGATDDQIATKFKELLQHRAKDGFEAEKRRNPANNASESMATIGG